MSYQFRFAYSTANWTGNADPYSTKTETTGGNGLNVGDLIVVAIPYRTGGSDVTITVQDDLGNTFTEIVGPRFFSTGDGNAGAKFFYSFVTSDGISTLTANYSFAVSSTGIFACVYSGFKSSPVGPFAGYARLTLIGGTDNDVSNPINVTSPPVMQVGFMFATSGPSNGARLTAGTGFNDRLTGQKPNGEADTIKFIDRRVTSITSSAVAKMSGTPDANGNVALFATLSFLENNTEPLIVGVGSETPRHQGTLSFTGQNFGTTQGSSVVTIGGVVQEVTSWSNTAITINVDRGSNRFGDPIDLVATISGFVTSYTLAGLLPQTGWKYVNLLSLASSADRLKSAADLEVGDQISYSAGQVFSDATFAVDQSTTSFQVAVRDSTFGWGPVITETVNSTISPGSSTLAGSSTASGIGSSTTATSGIGSAAGDSTAIAVSNAIVNARSTVSGSSTAFGIGESAVAGIAAAAGEAFAIALGIDRTQRLDIDMPFTQSTCVIEDDGYLTIDVDVAAIFIDAEVTYAA